MTRQADQHVHDPGFELDRFELGRFELDRFGRAGDPIQGGLNQPLSHPERLADSRVRW